MDGWHAGSKSKADERREWSDGWGWYREYSRYLREVGTSNLKTAFGQREEVHL